MIATCGHEVKQGIMATLIEDRTTSSYGSYCDKCIFEIHEHDDSLETGELKNLLEQMVAYKNACIKLTEGMEFIKNTMNEDKINLNMMVQVDHCARTTLKQADEILSKID